MQKIIKIFVLSAIVIIITGCGAKDTSNSTPTAEKAPAIESAPAKKYSRDEVAKHNTAENCWTIFKGKVYDITAAVPKHPAGPEKAMKACGVDISEGFEKNPVHASKGVKNLESLYI